MTPGIALHIRRFSGALALIVVIALPLAAEEDYGNRLGRRTSGQTTYTAVGPSILLEALDPSVQRWYLPQELFAEYGRRQWQYTNYARDPYRRYLERQLEGIHFYDDFGSFVTRGWIIYDWRQTRPRPFQSSQLTKPGRYETWFQRLVIGKDRSGDYGYSILIGDEINATLTPMTFRKAGFNGIATSLVGDRFRATGLFSRISAPIVEIDYLAPTVALSNSTNLSAGRFEADLTDFLTLGLTAVNSHNVRGSRESFRDNPFKGMLTAGQLSRQTNLLVVRLSDDSPEDDEGGAVLFSEDVEITTTLLQRIEVADSVQVVPIDTVITGSSIGFHAAREGGSVRDGFLTADGAESITLKYVLSPGETESEESSLRFLMQRHFKLTLAEAEDAINAISNVRFRLVLANDYRVEVTSDRQTNLDGQPQFLLVERAIGNIKNRLNQRQVVFDYGLPTAHLIYGITAEVRNFYGFDFYGEFNLSTRYRKYPAINREKHRAIAGTSGDREAVGWMINLTKRVGPYRLFAEAFGMDDEYSTSVKPVDGRGIVDFSPEATNRLYDFVDDNDDNDRHPDQIRFNQGSLIPIPGQTAFSIREEGVPDPAVFPGYDENGDFISDFNQNSNSERPNFFPDYDEPFLRYSSDRPEFLFGIDLNNNGWIDRFENDDLPDYPYKKDHWGYNLYSSVQINPAVKITLGHLNQVQRKTDRRNKTTYGIFTLERDWPTWGRVRVFDMLKKAEDDIPDPLSQWIMPLTLFGQAGETSGSNMAVPDPLAAENTWINTFYIDWEYASPRRWSTRHRFKWEVFRQREIDKGFSLDEAGNILLDEQENRLADFDPLEVERRDGRRTSGMVGLIDKVDCNLTWRELTFLPRFKSEFLHVVPFEQNEDAQQTWDALFFFLTEVPFLQNTRVQLGLEQRLFYNLKEKEDNLLTGTLTGDFRGTVFALQLSTTHPYSGYSLTTQLGLRYDRRSLEAATDERKIRTSGLAFLSMFVGL